MGGSGGFAFKRPAFPTTDFGGDCTFSLLTTLANPQASALSKVSVGERFPVRISKSSKALEMLNKEEESCGLILPRFARFTSCMALGVAYEAIVISLDGASCNVLVQNIK
jgi:hypothetical protein